MMKKAFAAAVLAAMTMSAQAAVVLNEGFDNVPGLAASGWMFASAGTPGGATSGWYQGTTSVFGAHSGEVYSYAAANYDNAPAGGSIDSWLITPVFDASLGATVSFYLRAAGEGYADRLNFGFINADGSFADTALTTINPVPDGDWTRYTAWVGANALGSARFAFQYVGTYDTANYVGLDTLSVDVPEPASIALFAGGLLGLGAMRRRARR
jgi:hypothetical protein